MTSRGHDHEGCEYCRKKMTNPQVFSSAMFVNFIPHEVYVTKKAFYRSKLIKSFNIKQNSLDSLYYCQFVALSRRAIEELKEVLNYNLCQLLI